VKNLNDTSGLSVFSENTIVKATVKSGNDFVIRGRFVGEITTTGAIIVKKTGVVRGDFWGKDIIVEGVLEGNCMATQMVSISNTGRIAGNIVAFKIVIMEDAEFDGSLSIVKNPEEIKKNRPQPVRFEHSFDDVKRNTKNEMTDLNEEDGKADHFMGEAMNHPSSVKYEKNNERLKLNQGLVSGESEMSSKGDDVSEEKKYKMETISNLKKEYQQNTDEDQNASTQISEEDKSSDQSTSDISSLLKF